MLCHGGSDIVKSCSGCGSDCDGVIGVVLMVVMAVVRVAGVIRKI